MRYTCTSGQASSFRTDAVVIPVMKMEKVTGRLLKGLDLAASGAVTTLVSSGEFTGKDGEVAVVYRPRGFRADRCILVGLGEAKDVNADAYRRAAGTISRHKALTSSTKAVFFLEGVTDAKIFQAAAEGFLLGSYTLLDYKTGEGKKSKVRLTELTFAVEKSSFVPSLKAAVGRGQIIAEGQNLVRRLAFMPSNSLTPRLYAKKVTELAKANRLGLKILDEKAIVREKMGLLLGVAQGSAEPPRFVMITYRGRRDNQKPIVLVGKGVTFDSGGISLKPGADMHEMKGDMAGSAIVLSTIITASKLKLPLNLVALMPLTENMPSGTAQKPGDIVTSRKGLTVEIINTDAEGRLILADALDYANTFKPQAVVDIATLTGAAIYVTGYSGAPILGNTPALMDQLKNAATATSERVWEMPIWDDFRDLMKSSVADLVNSGGRPAGTMTAAAFLENFIGDWPWAHIDIAYVDLEPKGKPYIPRGATGIGLRLLVELLSSWKPVTKGK